MKGLLLALVLMFSLAGFAEEVQELDYDNLHANLQFNLIRAKVKSIHEDYNSVDSWMKLEEKIKKNNTPDKDLLLAKLKEWKNTAFVKPEFEVISRGFSLTQGKDKIEFNLATNVTALNGKEFDYSQTGMTGLLDWLEGKNKTSMTSFFMSEAHAFIVPAAIVISAIVIMGVDHFLWSGCAEEYNSARKSIAYGINQCRHRMNNRPVTSTSVPTFGNKSCKKAMSDIYVYGVFRKGPCVDDFTAICNAATVLHQCEETEHEILSDMVNEDRKSGKDTQDDVRGSGRRGGTYGR